MHPTTEPAIGPGNDVFAADDRRIAEGAVGDQLRVGRSSF